jgi:nucleotide-binding universal stress UspA family protein
MTAPFTRVLVPYDGSDPAERALAFGLIIGRAGVGLDIIHVVDESWIISQSAAALETFDPTPIIDSLDDYGKALLAAARERAYAAGVDVSTTLIHEQPAPGIISFAEKNGDQLIILGTHARTGLPRAFLGSTSEGVLRAGTTPVLIVHSEMAPAQAPFRRLLVAVDDSDPADASLVFAAGLSQTLGSHCVLCNVVDSRDLEGKAASYGYDPTPFIAELRNHASDILGRASVQPRFAKDAVSVTIVKGEPARELVNQAIHNECDAIVMGSHGRRGLRRLFLGSVAEHVLRHSPIPVFVVRKKTDARS